MLAVDWGFVPLEGIEPSTCGLEEYPFNVISSDTVSNTYYLMQKKDWIIPIQSNISNEF